MYFASSARAKFLMQVEQKNDSDLLVSPKLNTKKKIKVFSKK